MSLVMSTQSACTLYRWICIWLEMLGDLIVLFVSIFAVTQDSSDPESGTVGLSLSYALGVGLEYFYTFTRGCSCRPTLYKIGCNLFS